MSTHTFEQILQHEIHSQRQGRLHVMALFIAIAVVIAGLVIAL